VNRDQRIYQELRRRNLRPGDLDAGQLRALVASIMTVPEKLSAAAEITVTEVRVRALGRKVTLEQLAVRRQACASNVCGLFSLDRHGLMFCGSCGCSGQLFQDRLQDPMAECPASPPVWRRELPQAPT